LAGVYPPALKLISTWFNRDRGIALGTVVGALTIGSSMPHLFRSLSGAVDWRLVVKISTLATSVGGVLLWLFAREGPYPFGRAIFDPRQAGAVFRDRDLLFANLGYFGHMWELYAMWAWLLLYVNEALGAQHVWLFGRASFLTFVTIGTGAFGCLLGGILSDRIGRTATTAGMMIVSGTCALAIGFAFGGPSWLFITILVIWGVSVIGDSAQFSAMITELADQRFVGTALSVQSRPGICAYRGGNLAAASDGCFPGFLAVDISHPGSRPVNWRFCHAVVAETSRQCAVGQRNALEIAVGV
jgi:nitrate/nitrite transporter NarK